MDTLTKAIIFAQEKHAGILDDSGLDYFEAHICQVVRILEQVTNDLDVLVAAYLHDTIEDTDTTYEELVKEFGERVANLVMEVTHDGHKDNYGRYFPRLKSKEAVLIKFADRLSNISRMEAWPPQRRQSYLRKSKFWKDGHELISNCCGAPAKEGYIESQICSQCKEHCRYEPA